MSGETAVDVGVYATALADGICDSLPGWVVGSVTRLMMAWAGAVPPGVSQAATMAGTAAVAEVGAQVRDLLAADIDEQWTTPLAILRGGALRYPTSVLQAAGVPPVVRDRAAEELFPDDLYDLVPASFADLDPSLAEAGLRWGAAKAFEYKRRHGGAR